MPDAAPSTTTAPAPTPAASTASSVKPVTPAAPPAATTPSRPSSGMSGEQRLAMLQAMDGGKSARDAKTAALAATPAKPAPATAKPADAEAVKSEGDKPKPEAETKPAHDDTPEKRAQLIQARRVLIRQGFTADEVAAMEAGNAAGMLQRAEKFAKAQEATDKAFKAAKGGDGAEGKSKPNTSAEGDRPAAEGDTAARRSGGASNDDDGEPSGNPGQAAELDSVLDDLVLEKDERKKLLQYDRTLRATHAQALQKVTQQHARQVEEYEGAIDQLITALSEDRAQSARAALSAEFPGLKDDAAFARVLRRVGRMDPNQEALVGTTDAYRQLWRDAAYVEFGPALKEQARNELLAGNAASRDGQPDGVGVRPAAGALSAEERKARLLELYDSTGGSGPEFERGKAALGTRRR